MGRWLIILWFITSKYDGWVLIWAWVAIRMNTVFWKSSSEWRQCTFKKRRRCIIIKGYISFKHLPLLIGYLPVGTGIGTGWVSTVDGPGLESIIIQPLAEKRSNYKNLLNQNCFLTRLLYKWLYSCHGHFVIKARFGWLSVEPVPTLNLTQACNARAPAVPCHPSLVLPQKWPQRE